MTDAARALVVAEDRLRASGLTGSRAFEAVVAALRQRLGDDVRVDPIARDAIAAVPLDGVDLMGLAYERFFPDLFKGKRGQYFTPRALGELLADVAGIGPDDDVLDPTCGSGGLLVCAARRGARVRGIDRDPLLAELAALNLRLCGVEPRVRTADFFASDPEPADVVIANPPFSVVIDDPAVLERYSSAAGRDRALSDALFVEALAAWVRPGGRAAIVMPSSLVLNPSAAELRDGVDAAFVRTAIVALPEGVFRPFGGAAGRACLLWLTRRPAASVPTRWASVVDPGWDTRLTRWKSTSDAEVTALKAGRGWTELPAGAWVPPGAVATGPRRPVAELAEQASDPRPAGECVVIDLADADKSTGEVVAARVGPAASRTTFAAGDVLVAKLRPELGNVAIASDPTASGRPLAGSGEWCALRSPKGHYLLHALRTPAWRASLPTTAGQTRPRIHARDVLASEVAWPGDALAERIASLSSRIHAERAALRVKLDALQAAVDGFAAGDLDGDGLADVLAGLEAAHSRLALVPK
jgi:methylase of polypeptide subunit release factors